MWILTISVERQPLHQWHCRHLLHPNQQPSQEFLLSKDLFVILLEAVILMNSNANGRRKWTHFALEMLPGTRLESIVLQQMLVELEDESSYCAISRRLIAWLVVSAFSKSKYSLTQKLYTDSLFLTCWVVRF